MNSSPLSAHFQLQPQDVRALSRHVMRSPESVRAIGGALLVVLALLLAFGFFWQRRLDYYYFHRIGPVTGPPGAIHQLLVVPPLLLCGFWLFLIWHQKPLMGFNTRTPISITLSNEGVLHQSGGAEVHTQWSAIRKVEATQQHLFLWASSERIFIVPRRAFDSQEEFAQFRDFARRHQEAARRARPEPPPIAQV